MRAYSLALLVFMFALSLSLVNSTIITAEGIGAVGIGEQGQTAEEWVFEKSDDIKDIGIAPTDDDVDEQETFSWYNAVYKPIVYGIPFVIGLFVDCTFGLYWLLEAVGVPQALALILSAGAWCIYIFGIIQWITNRSFKQSN